MRHSPGTSDNAGNSPARPAMQGTGDRSNDLTTQPLNRTKAPTPATGVMSAAMAMPGNTACTYLTHHFGGGLDGDDRFVVERFRALGSGKIRPVPPHDPKANGRRTAGRTVVSRSEAEATRPDRTEIIIATGLCTRGGIQAWGFARNGASVQLPPEGLTETLQDVRPVQRLPGAVTSDSTPRQGGSPMCEQEDIKARRARDLERWRKRVGARRAAGPCEGCGRREPAPNRTRCEPCLEKGRIAKGSTSVRPPGSQPGSVSDVAGTLRSRVARPVPPVRRETMQQAVPGTPGSARRGCPGATARGKSDTSARDVAALTRNGYLRASARSVAYVEFHMNHNPIIGQQRLGPAWSGSMHPRH